MVHCVGSAKGVGGPHEVGPRRAKSSEKGKWFGSGAFEGGGPEPPFPVRFEGPLRGGPEPLFRFEEPLRGAVQNPYSLYYFRTNFLYPYQMLSFDEIKSFTRALRNTDHEV